MPKFKIGSIEVSYKNFRNPSQVTDKFSIDVNKVVLSDKVSCNKGKDWEYVVGFQVDGESIVPLCIKTPKIIFSYGVSQCNINSSYTMSYTILLLILTYCFWGSGVGAVLTKHLEGAWIAVMWEANNGAYKTSS